MPRGHGRIGSNIEKVVGRRNHSLGRRSLDESNYKLISEERQISALILGNTEQSRCIIFTLVAPELDAYCKRATILQALQSPEQRNHSTAPSESPPTLIFLVNLQKVHSTILSESTCSAESSSPCSSSGMNIMGQSRNRNKRTKSLKDSSNSSGLQCFTADTSSGSLCDSLSPPSFDDLVSDISKVEQPRKRSSKKKGKKKGKHYKRSIAKEDSTELDGHCERSTCSTPVVEISMGCPPDCLGKQISEKSSEKLSFSPTYLLENITTEKDVNATNNCADSSTTMMSCVSNNDEMESEAVDSQSQEFAHEKLTRHSLRELKSTSSATKSNERIPSTVYVNIKSASPNQSINYNDNSTRISMDLCDDAAAGSFQDHWKTDDANGNCSNDVETRLPIMDKEGLDISGEVDSDFRKFEVNSDSWKYDPSFHWTTGDSLVMNNEVSNDCCTSSSYWSEGVVRADSSTERAQCSSEACSSNDFRPVLSGKRGRAARKSTARTGKDNHPVWQKVQKMENRCYINKPKSADAVSTKADNPSKNSSARERVNASSGLNQIGKHIYSHETVSETSKSSEINPKNKHSSISKQVNHHPRKGSHNGTVNPGRPKIHVQQKEGLSILPQVNHDEHTSSQLSSLNSTDSPIPLIKSTEKFDLCPSVQQQKTKEHTDEESLSGNTGSMAGEMTSAVACKQIGQSLLTFDPSRQSHKIDIDGHADNNLFQGYANMEDDLCLMDSMDNQYKKLQAECSQAEYSEPDNNSGPVLQKWVHVGRKDAAVSQTPHIENLTASVLDDSISNVLDSKNGEIEVGSEAQSIVPLTGLEMQGSSRSGDDADCSSSETDILSDKLVSCSHADEGCVVHNESNLQLSQEDQKFLKFETDLDKIMNAANDAFKLQTTAGVPLLAGSPLAEVERFMCSASPVISQRNHDRICTACSGGQQNSNSLCVDQIHNLSLASLWRWYEEPGCYGLEVKAEENHKSKRLCDGFVEFRAYFVPSLSAMQLFRRSGSSYASSSGVVIESSEVDKASSSSSNLASLPIFSTLLPRPHAADACLLESTSSVTNKFCSQSAKDTNLFDEELIFEYFEHAQPPQRRPLFDKIKELINYDRSSNSQIYGDPSKLECLSLHDLHPASWYAVAWYPIYRIPEGNFRAAFITYHSLGHFTHQSTSNMTGDFTRITSPVVGLQSYNAKKECWFQPRDLKSIEAQKEESSVSSPPIVLERRLKTLERTASVMATATVRKGNQRSVNNHPDYNHFTSRW